MSTDENKKSTIEVKKLPHSEIEISGEIHADEFESYYEGAIRSLRDEVEIPGFRKGHVPEKVLIEKVGLDAILHEMAEIALSEHYPKILAEHALDAIGRPEITITKIARGNPLGFKAKTAVLPQFTLPDYKTTAHNIPDDSHLVSIADKEVDETIDTIRKNFKRPAESGDAGKETSSAQTRGSGAILGPDGKPLTGEASKEDALPALTDEFVKQFGAFETVADFKTKIKENVLIEKRARAKEKRRAAIVDALIREIKIELPDILIESELDRMLAWFKTNISAMGHSFDEYLKQIKKTEQNLRDGWRGDAEKGVKTQLLLQKIADTEKITVPEAEIEKEIKHITEEHPNTDRDRLRRYVEDVLRTERAFAALEGKQGDSSLNR